MPDPVSQEVHQDRVAVWMAPRSSLSEKLSLPEKLISRMTTLLPSLMSKVTTAPPSAASSMPLFTETL